MKHCITNKNLIQFYLYENNIVNMFLADQNYKKLIATSTKVYFLEYLDYLLKKVKHLGGQI